MKGEAGCDVGGNGVRNESRTLKEGEEEENGGATCVPLLCFVLTEVGSRAPGLVGTEAANSLHPAQ